MVNVTGSGESCSADPITFKCRGLQCQRKELKFASWNVRTLLEPLGVADYFKLKLLATELKRFNISLVALSETRWLGSGVFEFEESGDRLALIYSAYPIGHEKQAGVVLFC